MSEASQLGPSYDGTVMLDIGGDVGALIINTPPAMHLVEIEISRRDGAIDDVHTVEHAHSAGETHDGLQPHAHEADGHGHAHTSGAQVRTHVAVRERRGPSGTRYAAIYPNLHEGTYTVWHPDGPEHRTVEIVGGEVRQIDWSQSE